MATEQGRLAGRVVVVVGATGGIGAACARALVGEGAQVVCAAREPVGLERLLETLAAEVASEGGRRLSPTAVPTDITDQDSVTRLFRTAAGEHGRVDVLVNAAGVLKTGAIQDISLEEWNRILCVNLTGVFLCCQAAVRQMLTQPEGPSGLRGHIVQLVSGAGVHGWAGAVAYTASKYGVMGLSEVLREEVRLLGIKVTEILPGMVDTEMTADSSFAEAAKLSPADVAHMVIAALTTSPEAMLIRLDLRHVVPGGLHPRCLI